MTIINPDHEAAIAAFHRAAARAGTGGDGRYARAVAHLEPSVRRDLEARIGVTLNSIGPGARAGMANHLRGIADAMEAGAEVLDGGLYANGPLQLGGSITLAEPPKAAPQPQASGEVVETPCPRCGKPVLSWTRIPDATAVCLHCTEIAPQPPAEAQRPGSNPPAPVGRKPAPPPSPPSAPGCGACADGCKDRGSCRVRDESPPSAPVGVEAMPGIRRELAGIVRRDDGEPVWIEPNEAAAILRALAQQPAAVDEAMVRRVLDFKPSWSGVTVREYLIEGGMKHWSPASYLYDDEKSKPYRIVEQALTAALAAQPQGAGHG